MSGIFRYNSNITPPRRPTSNPFCITGQDATMDHSYAMGFRSPTSFNMLPGANGNPGNISPGQGRSLREYDEKLHALQKENFQLKLRLFFLEEKTPVNASGKSDEENLFKQTVDLKVENEELRKELQEKQDLLCQAAKAMELMEDSQKNSYDNNSATVIDLKQKIDLLEEQIRSMDKSTSSQSMSHGIFGRPLSSTEIETRSLPSEQELIKLAEMTKKISELEKQITERDETIKHLEKSIADRDEASLMCPMDSIPDDMDIESMRKKLAEQTQLMIVRENEYQDLKDQLANVTGARDRGFKTIQLLMKRTHDMNEELEKFKSKELKLQTTSASSLNSSATINSLKADLARAKSETEQSHAWRKECADVCAVLTIRLQELAGFLDTLLKHKDVLSVLAQDRHKAMRKAVDRSLDLSRSLNNMSISGGPGRFSLDEKSLMQFSSVSELLNHSYFNSSLLTENKENISTANISGGLKLTHNFLIENLKAENKELKEEIERLSAESALSSGMISGLELKSKERSNSKLNNLSLRVEANSESEAWSEPDRKVSHERIGLDDSIKLNTHVRSFNGKYDASSSGSELAANTSSQLARKNSVLRLQEKIANLETELNATVEQNERIQQSLADTENCLIIERKLTKKLGDDLEIIRKSNDDLLVEKENVRTRCDEIQLELYEQIAKYEQVFNERQIKIEEIQLLKESYETEMNAIQQKYATEIDTMASQENVKLELLRQQLTDNFNKAIEEREHAFEMCLERDWVSRVTHEEKLQQLQETEMRFGDSQTLLQLIRENEIEIKAQLAEKDGELRTMKRDLDEASLQTSKAVLERTKVMNERDQLEQQNRDLQDKFDNVSLEKAELGARHANLSAYASKIHNRLVEKDDINYQLSRSASQGNARYTLSMSHNAGTSSGGEHSGYTSDELKQRLDNSSPDLGIESDATARSSGTDANLINLRPEFKLSSPKSILFEGDEEDVTSTQVVPQNLTSNASPLIIQHDCEKIERENIHLRSKLEKTRRAFEKTWAQLRISNQRKEQIEKDIRQEIYKTHSVLKNVRSNMENVGQQQQQKSPLNKSSESKKA